MAAAVKTQVVFSAYPVQQRLFDTARDGQSRLIGFGGGIRGTKTFGVLALLLTLCRVFPRSRWAVVRMDLPTLRRNTLPSFEKLRTDFGFDRFVSAINQSDWTATCTNGSQIIFFPESLDTDPDLSRWKGLEVNGFALEECDELAERSFYKAIERAGAWIIPNAQQPPRYVFCTFNPCANWPKRLFYEPWKHGTLQAPYAFIPATARDNPSISPEQWDAWASLPEQEYQRFVEGDWDVLSGRYYDALNGNVHLIEREALPERIPAWWEAWCAYDWGYAHWATMGLFVKDADGVIYLLDAHRMRKAQDAEQADALARLCADNGLERALDNVYAGHDAWERRMARGASGTSTADVFSARGVHGLVKADTDKVNGGRAVRRALHVADGRTGFAFVKQANGMPQLAFDQLAEIMPDESDVNKPAKVDADSEGRGGDDWADMIRYGLATRVPAAVEPIVRAIPGPQQDPMALVAFDDDSWQNGPMTTLGTGF